MGKYNFSFFQIPHTGVSCDGALGDQQTRCADGKMSSFGELSYNLRSSEDYTRFTKGFKSKDELQNPDIPYFLPTGNGGNVGNAINNPYVWGSTTHKARNDEFFIMLLGTRNQVSAEQPNFDVMDTNLAWDTTVSGMALNFPTEGYVSFGGRTGGPFEYRVSK